MDTKIDEEALRALVDLHVKVTRNNLTYFANSALPDRHKVKLPHYIGIKHLELLHKPLTEQLKLIRTIDYDNAMAGWIQTGFELSLLKDSESPEDYKAMMDEHMADKHRMAKEVFYDQVFKGIEEDYDIPF